MRHSEAPAVLQDGLQSRKLRTLSREMGIEPRKLRAVVALLEGRTMTSAARAAGVGRATLYRWVDDPVFLAAYGQLQHEYVGSVRRSLKAMAGEALGMLRGLLTDPKVPAAVRLAAVREVLGYALEEPSTPATPEGAETQLRARRISASAGGTAKPLIR